MLMQQYNTGFTLAVIKLSNQACDLQCYICFPLKYKEIFLRREKKQQMG